MNIIFKSQSYKNLVKRCFNKSDTLNRRPPHHRSLFRSRHFPFNTVYYDNDKAGPFKVVIDELNCYPPGQWGSMPIKDAWKRYNESQQLREIPTYFDKLLSLSWTEKNMWYHTIDVPIKKPETLLFSQFITRTKIDNSMPDIVKDSFSNISADDIKSASDLLKLQLNSYLSQKGPLISKHDLKEQERQSNELIIQIMDTIMRSKRKPDFFENYTTYPTSLIETFMKRSGYEEIDVPEIVKDKEGCIKYRFRGKLAWQLRTRFPLKEFVNRDNPIFMNDGNQIPRYNYHPKTFDLEPTDCFEFQNVSFTYALESFRKQSEYARNIPGFWGTNHIRIGDPCGFSVLGVVNTSRNDKLRMEFESEHPEIVERNFVSEGVLSGFVWTMAQAQNQGFTIYDELTYPICTSLLLTDGRSVQMMYYQLNSISSLWKPEDAGLPVNMMWVSPKMDLYNLDDKQQIDRVNEHAVHQILASCSMSSTEMNTEDLQPYLKDKAPKDVENFLIDFDPETATQKELDEYERKSAIRQLCRSPSPHPNRIFYFNQLSRYDMAQDIRNIVPGVDVIPDTIHKRLKKHKLKLERSKGKQRVLKLPSEWK